MSVCFLIPECYLVVILEVLDVYCWVDYCMGICVLMCPDVCCILSTENRDVCCMYDSRDLLPWYMSVQGATTSVV